MSFVLPVAVAAALISNAFAATGLEHWELLFEKPSFRNGFIAIAASHDHVVVVEEEGPITSWSHNAPQDRVSFQPGFPVQDVAYGNGMFIAVGRTNHTVNSTQGIILRSPDGVNWEAQIEPATTSLRAVVFGNGVFLAEGHNVLLRSSNGVDWVPQPKAPFSGFPNFFFAGDYFIIIHGLHQSTNSFSRQANDWTSVAAPWGGIYSLGQIRERYVALSVYNDIYTSPDALAWTKHGKLEGIQRPMNIASGNGYLLAGGGRQEGGGAIGWSRDGVHWTVSLTAGNVRGLAFSNGRFLALQVRRNEQKQLLASVWQSGPVVAVEIPEPGLIAISGVPNADYRIESTSTLNGSNQWNVDHEFQLEGEMTYTWSDPGSAADARFYRVVVQE